MLFPGLVIQGVFTDTEEGAAQLSFCPAIMQPGFRICAEPSRLGSDTTAPQSYSECIHVPHLQICTKAPILIYKIFIHTFPRQEGNRTAIVSILYKLSDGRTQTVRQEAGSVDK